LPKFLPNFYLNFCPLCPISAQRQEEQILGGGFLEKVKKVRTWFTIVLSDLHLFNISP